MDVETLRSQAKLRVRGRGYDAFVVGEEMVHHWGRTITTADTIQFSHLTLSYNPLYLNVEYAKAHGHPDLVVNPQLVFNTVLGLSVEDCSEGIGGPFLGIDALTFHEPVYPGDTLTARSTTVDKRLSETDPDRGVVTWRTEGFNQDGRRVVDFRRSNLAVFSAAKRMQEA